MASPLILARTFKEAHAYATDELGLKVGHYRVVSAPGTLRAVRNADLHLVPGWDKRPDRFGMKGALRYCRLNIIDVEKVRESQAAFDAVTPAPVEEDRYPLDERTHTLEEAPAELPEPADAVEATGEEPETVEAEPEVIEKPKKRRRTKCKDCNTLHFKGEPCNEDV